MAEQNFNADFSLKNRVVAVTGAAGWLGRAMAFAIANAGANVILTGRNEQKLEQLARDMAESGLEAVVFRLDNSDADAGSRLAAFVDNKFGKLCGLVNNAYSGGAGDFETANRSDFQNACDMAITSSFDLTQKLLPLMRKSAGLHGDASIVNISSMYATVSPDFKAYKELSPNPPFYGAAKAGLLQLTRYMACYLGPDGIRANAITPGPFPGSDVQESEPEFIAQLEQRTPMNRIGKPDDLAGPVCFLLSPSASYVNGITLPVDGGWTAW